LVLRCVYRILHAKLFLQKLIYEHGLKGSRPNNAKKKKNKFTILKLFLFLNIISVKTNTFIPPMLERNYPVPVVVLRKICKIPLYSCNRLLIRRKTLTREEEFEFWEEREVRGGQIWRTGGCFNNSKCRSLNFPITKTLVGGCVVMMKDDFFLQPGSSLAKFFRLVCLKD